MGKSEYEALKNYAPVHAHAERLLRSARPDVVTDNPIAVKSDIEAQFAEARLDPYSPGKTPEEEIARSEEADRILSNYPLDPDTGHPDPDSLSPRDRATVSALLNGIQSIDAELVISQAFEFYLGEKTDPDPYKRQKQMQRFSRAQSNLLHVVRQDIAISRVTRAHARQLRDHLLQTMAVSSVKRNINDVKAVFSLATREHDLNINNPFAKLDYPKPKDAAVDLRHPLPPDVIKAMYKELEDQPVLLDIWTLIHHSGAQSAEILGLRLDDLKLDDPVPHFEIKPQRLRTVKKRSRIRKVPLVGRALMVATRLAKASSSEGSLFPNYADTRNHDSFGQAARKHLRKHTKNSKHVIYSLRHNMKDALRRANVGERVELALLGHSDERTSSAQYGSGVGLQELQAALTSGCSTDD
ncbi:MAG: tyrosine-type recombinase/integrase [Pseudomonadota bacterium]